MIDSLGTLWTAGYLSIAIASPSLGIMSQTSNPGLIKYPYTDFYSIAPGVNNGVFVGCIGGLLMLP